MPATHSEDLLANKSVNKEMSSRTNMEEIADKTKALSVDWSCAEEECK